MNPEGHAIYVTMLFSKVRILLLGEALHEVGGDESAQLSSEGKRVLFLVIFELPPTVSSAFGVEFD
jgi:hypothetical protein